MTHNDDLETLRIVNRRLIVLIKIFIRIMDALEGQMFLPSSVPPLIRSARKQIDELQVSIMLSEMIIAHEK